MSDIKLENNHCLRVYADYLEEQNKKLEDRNDMLSKNMYQLAKNSTVKISELEEEKKSYKDKYEFLMKQSTDSPYKGLLEINIKEYNQLKQELAELKTILETYRDQTKYLNDRDYSSQIELNRLKTTVDLKHKLVEFLKAEMNTAVKERDELKSKAEMQNNALTKYLMVKEALEAKLDHALESVKMACEALDKIYDLDERDTEKCYAIACETLAKLKERHVL